MTQQYSVWVCSSGSGATALAAMDYTLLQLFDPQAYYSQLPLLQGSPWDLKLRHNLRHQWKLARQGVAPALLGFSSSSSSSSSSNNGNGNISSHSRSSKENGNNISSGGAKGSGNGCGRSKTQAEADALRGVPVTSCASKKLGGSIPMGKGYAGVAAAGGGGGGAGAGICAAAAYWGKDCSLNTAGSTRSHVNRKLGLVSDMVMAGGQAKSGSSQGLGSSQSAACGGGGPVGRLLLSKSPSPGAAGAVQGGGKVLGVARQSIFSMGGHQSPRQASPMAPGVALAFGGSRQSMIKGHNVGTSTSGGGGGRLSPRHRGAAVGGAGVIIPRGPRESVSMQAYKTGKFMEGLIMQSPRAGADGGISTARHQQQNGCGVDGWGNGGSGGSVAAGVSAIVRRVVRDAGSSEARRLLGL